MTGWCYGQEHSCCGLDMQLLDVVDAVEASTLALGWRDWEIVWDVI